MSGSRSKMRSWVLASLTGITLTFPVWGCGDDSSIDGGATTSGRGGGSSHTTQTTATGATSGTASTSSNGGAGGGTSDGVHFDPALLGPAGLAAPMGCEAKAGGSCRYVSPSGSGTTCTETDPCKVKTAVDSLTPGDVVLFQAGTYDVGEGSEDRIFLDKYHELATSADAPIVFTAVHGDEVILHGNGQDACIWIDGTGYLTFEGMVIESCFEAGIRIAEDAPDSTDHVTVRNNEFHDISCNDNMGAIMVNGTASVTFENNVIHDFSKNGGKGLGMVLFRARDLTVRNNEFYSLAEGIYYKHGEAMEGNGGFTHFYANYFHDIDSMALGVNQNRSEIAYDIFEDTGGVMLFQADGTVGDFLFDVHAHHDTFIRSGFSPMQRGDGFSGAQDTTLDHSIFVDGAVDVWRYGLDADFDAGVGFASDQNCFFSTDGPPELDYFASDTPAYGPEGASYSFTDWQGLGYDTGSSVVDPGLDMQTFHASAPECAAYGAYGG